jgi:hypothetical protein
MLRSMMSASARMEAMMSGQMGQPSSMMMASNGVNLCAAWVREKRQL